MNKQTAKDSTIKNQQAGRRLSGNQQRELTTEQTKHPERVQSTAEKMLDNEKEHDKASSDNKKK